MRHLFVFLLALMLLCGQPAMATNLITGFGGDGSAGAVTKGTTSDSLLQINATSFVQSSSTTYTVTSVQINDTQTATFAGTTSVTATVSGANTVFNAGYGPGGGGYGSANNAGVLGLCGGGGGGFGGAGGNGGTQYPGYTGGTGGASYAITNWWLGSGGGTNASSYNGGNGGGAFHVCSIGNITVSGAINADGMAGVTGYSAASGGEYGGTGGGSGGFVGLYSQGQVIVSSSNGVTAKGGAGGAAGGSAYSGAGGGGGGGRIVLMSTTAPSVSGSTNVTAGAAGSGGASTPLAQAGSSGAVTSITGRPNLPIIAIIEGSSVLALMEAVHGKDEHDTCKVSKLEIVQAGAALTCKPHQFGNLCYALEYGGIGETRLSNLTVTTVKGMGENDIFEPAAPISERVEVGDLLEDSSCV